MKVGMQEAGWICNLYLLQQVCDGQHSPMSTSCWANPLLGTQACPFVWNT